MLEFYKVRYYAIIEDEKFLLFSSDTLLNDNSVKLENHVDTITWDNVNILQEKYHCDCSVKQTKKGRVLTIFDDLFMINVWKKFKEWKDKINIPIIEENKKITVSLNKVLDWYNAEEAIQYLNEHGLSINGAI